MSISLHRAQAIFVKDYKEFSRNYAVSIMLILPILLAFLFRSVGASLPGASGFLFNISLVLVPCFTQACLIAEEKERNTLRSLMLTPATKMDILIGKSALVFVISTVVLILATFVFGYYPASIGGFLTIMTLSIMFYIAVGTICGLFSKTLLDASLAIMPVLFVFMGAPWGAFFDKKYPILKVLSYMPSSQLVHFLNVSKIGSKTRELQIPIFVILVWTVVLSCVCLVLYQRRLKDE